MVGAALNWVAGGVMPVIVPAIEETEAVAEALTLLPSVIVIIGTDAKSVAGGVMEVIVPGGIVPKVICAPASTIAMPKPVTALPSAPIPEKVTTGLA